MAQAAMQAVVKFNEKMAQAVVKFCCQGQQIVVLDNKFLLSNRVFFGIFHVSTLFSARDRCFQPRKTQNRPKFRWFPCRHLVSF